MIDGDLKATIEIIQSLQADIRADVDRLNSVTTRIERAHRDIEFLQSAIAEIKEAIENKKEYKLYSSVSMAQMLSLSPQAIRNMAREGKIPCYHYGRKRMFDAQEVKEAIRVSE